VRELKLAGRGHHHATVGRIARSKDDSTTATPFRGAGANGTVGATRSGDEGGSERREMRAGGGPPGLSVGLLRPDKPALCAPARVPSRTAELWKSSAKASASAWQKPRSGPDQSCRAHTDGQHLASMPRWDPTLHSCGFRPGCSAHRHPVRAKGPSSSLCPIPRGAVSKPSRKP
jgi:hypothetical protein